MNTTTSSGTWEGALRGLGMVVLGAVLVWLTDPSNTVTLLGGSVSAIVVILASSLENFIKTQGGGALFGAIKTR